MTKMGYTTNILIVFVLMCCYVNADQCTARGGQCKKTTSGWWVSYRKSTCSNGRFISNLCSGSSKIKCCVPNTPVRTTTTTNSRCTSRGGQCKKTSSGWWSRRSTCSNGRFISNLCSSNTKCCVPNTPIRTPTRSPTKALAGVSTSGSYKCYGDFMKLKPVGASSKTSRQDGLSYTGVRASNKMVDTDLAELNKRKQCYIRAGQNSCIHPAVIAAVASRETRGGRLLYKTKGWGDNGAAWGIMQCDVKHSGLGNTCTKYGWDSCDHINQMTQTILLKYVKTIKSKHPSWASEYHIKGGVAAYNVGTKNVRTIARMDVGTTGDDYSNDVIARAQRLANEHGW